MVFLNVTYYVYYVYYLFIFTNTPQFLQDLTYLGRTAAVELNLGSLKCLFLKNS